MVKNPNNQSVPASKILPLVYDELRKLAAAKLARERPGQTLQATALVHEVYLKLAPDEDVQFQGRGHFFAAAAEAMRRLLIDRAREKRAKKRGEDWDCIDFAESELLDFTESDRSLR